MYRYPPQQPSYPPPQPGWDPRREQRHTYPLPLQNAAPAQMDSFATLCHCGSPLHHYGNACRLWTGPGMYSGNAYPTQLPAVSLPTHSASFSTPYPPTATPPQHVPGPSFFYQGDMVPAGDRDRSPFGVNPSFAPRRADFDSNGTPWDERTIRWEERVPSGSAMPFPTTGTSQSFYLASLPVRNLNVNVNVQLDPQHIVPSPFGPTAASSSATAYTGGPVAQAPQSAVGLDGGSTSGSSSLVVSEPRKTASGRTSPHNGTHKSRFAYILADSDVHRDHGALNTTPLDLERTVFVTRLEVDCCDKRIPIADYQRHVAGRHYEEKHHDEFVDCHVKKGCEFRGNNGQVQHMWRHDFVHHFSVKFVCAWRHRGCKANHLRRDSMKTHQTQNCKFNPFTCPSNRKPAHDDSNSSSAPPSRAVKRKRRDDDNDTDTLGDVDDSSGAIPKPGRPIKKQRNARARADPNSALAAPSSSV